MKTNSLCRFMPQMVPDVGPVLLLRRGCKDRDVVLRRASGHTVLRLPLPGPGSIGYYRFLQRQPRLPELPDAGGLQVLQAGAGTRRGHRHPRETLRLHRLLRGLAHDPRSHMVHPFGLEGVTGIPSAGRSHDKHRPRRRRRHWKHAGEGDEA